MEVVKSITKEQLAKVVEQQKEINSVITNIGVLEAQKHSMLHKLAEVNKSIEDTKQELEAEYGSININLEDGSYTDAEEVVTE